MYEISKIDSNIKCLLVGDGPRFIYIQKMITRLKLDKVVFVTGKYSGNISDVYQFIDISVLVTMHEGLPYAISEAMSYKLPVIASNVGGIPEQIDNEINGFLINNNYEELVEKIIYISRDIQVRKKMGDNAFNTVKNKLTINSMVENIDSLLV